MSNVVHKLLRPVKFEDKTYEMIPLDLDSLSGRDIKEANKEFELANPQKVSFVLSADSDFAALRILKTREQFSHLREQVLRLADS